MGVGEEGLLAIRHPAHRAAERTGREEHQPLFRVDCELDAESSADVGRADPQALRIDPEHRLREHRTNEVHPLTGGVQGVAAGVGIVEANRTSRFHRIDDHTVVDQRHRSDVDGPRKSGPCRLRIPDLPIEAARKGVLQVDPRRAGPIVDIEHFGGVAGRVEGFRDHHGDTFPYVSHGIGREQAPGGRVERRSVPRIDLGPTGQGADSGSQEIAAGKDGDDSLASERRIDVHRPQRRVRVGRAHDDGLQGARKLQIARVLPRSPQETLVLHSQSF